MNQKKLILSILIVGLSTVGASAGLTPIDTTGWSVEDYGPFEGSVSVTYRGTSDNAIWIELDKEFNSDVFVGGDYGQPAAIKFVLTNSQAVNFAPNIVIAEELIVNNTGINWLDFHMTLSWDFFNYDPYVGFDPQYIFAADLPPYNPFQTVDFADYIGLNGMPVSLNFDDGQVADGETFKPGYYGSDDNYVRIVTDMDEGQYFILKEWPTIPEPTTLLLLSGGFVALRFMKQR